MSDCDYCFNTRTLDTWPVAPDGTYHFVEVASPHCAREVKITGLGWGLALHGPLYETCLRHTETTMTFVGTKSEILTDVVRVRSAAECQARLTGLKGRNYITSGAIAIEKRVRKALAS